MTQFHLADLPQHDFCVLFDLYTQKELVERAAIAITLKTKINWGKYKSLGSHLKTSCKSLSELRPESISDSYIPQWKRCTKFIPVDCVMELCKLSGSSVESIEENIRSIKLKSSPNKSAISFKFLYDVPFATLAEIVKAEGHIKKNFSQCTICNEDMGFILYVKRLIKQVGIPDNSVYSHVKIEAAIPNTDVKEVIDSGGKLINFYIRYDGKKVSFCDTQLGIGGKKEYEIILCDGRRIKLRVTIPRDSKIVRESSYAICSAVFTLTITNMTFAKLLSLLAGVPSGKKSKIIRMSTMIYTAPLDVKRSVIGAVFACEGWIEQKSRRIRFYVDSRDYITDLKNLLEMFGVVSCVEKRGYISITGRENINLFSKNFDIPIKEKKAKIANILDTYQRTTFTKGECLKKVMMLLSHDALSCNAISKELKRHKDTIFSQVNKGISKGYIRKDITNYPYIYSLTEEGLIAMCDINDMSRH